MAPSIGKTPFDRAGWIFELKYFLPYFPGIAACLETLPSLGVRKKGPVAVDHQRCVART